jgi:hypothetical protein
MFARLVRLRCITALGLGMLALATMALLGLYSRVNDDVSNTRRLTDAELELKVGAQTGSRYCSEYPDCAAVDSACGKVECKEVGGDCGSFVVKYFHPETCGTSFSQVACVNPDYTIFWLCSKSYACRCALDPNDGSLYCESVLFSTQCIQGPPTDAKKCFFTPCAGANG